MWNVAVILGALHLLFHAVQGQGRIPKSPTYIVVAPTKIRPNEDVVISISILKLELSNTFTVQAVIKYLVHNKPAEQISSAQHTFTRPGSHNIILKTPSIMAHGNYSMKVSGFSDPSLEGLIFANETSLAFDSKQVSVFIFTAKPWYSQRQVVRMRIIPLTRELKPVSTAMDVSLENANGLVVKTWRSQHTNAGGVINLSYPLNSHFIGYGIWTIKVRCLGVVYSKIFRVEEFYFPIFFPKASTANYMYQSKALTGTCFSLAHRSNSTVRVELLNANDSKVSNVSLTRVLPPKYTYGVNKFAVPPKALASLAGGTGNLIGKQLKVTVSVTDWTSNITVDTHSTTRVFSDKIVLEFLGGKFRTFKPNVPLKIFIAVQRADNSRLSKSDTPQSVTLIITRSNVDGTETTVTVLVRVPRTSIVEHSIQTNSSTEKIFVKAQMNGRLDTEQRLKATKEWSPNNHYLNIATTTTDPKVGEFIIFDIHTTMRVDCIYYYIVSSGNIVLSDRLAMHSRHRLLSIAITKKMSPDATIVAFYIASDRQVAADSLQFHVDVTKLHKMDTVLYRGKDLTAKEVNLKLEAEPSSYVTTAMKLVDMAGQGFVNSFTWEEVYRELYTYDNSLTPRFLHHWKSNGQVRGTFRAAAPTFGHDPNSTFFNSGLYIFTDANVSSMNTTCNRTKGEYPCMDGESCYNYDQICDKSAVCARDHRDEMGCPLSLHPGQQPDLPDTALNDDRNLWRTQHTPFWQNDAYFGWKDTYTKADGRDDVTLNPPILQIPWQINSFSLHPEHGLAISKPVTQQLLMGNSLSVSGARSIKFGEILSLKLRIRSQWEEPIDALISIPASKAYEFVQIERDHSSRIQLVKDEHQILVPLLEKQMRDIYVPIRPKRVGPISIPVKLLSVIGEDNRVWKVFVTHSGVPDITNITSYQVDLRTTNSEKLPDLHIPVDEEPQLQEERILRYIPGSAQSTISVIGDIVGIPLSPKAGGQPQPINLMDQPYYSGSGATFNLAVNIYTLNMVKSLGKISNSKLQDLTFNSFVAIQELFGYLQSDGSFLEFRWSQKPSTWLSATALDVMAEGVLMSDLEDYFQLPSEVLNLTSSWLLKQQDKKTGRFIETGPEHNRLYASKTDIERDEGTVDGNLALTALCVASLKKAADVTSLDAKVVRAIELGSGYLAENYAKTNDPLEMAIVTHTLLVAGEDSASKQAMFRLRSMNRTVRDMKYWSDEDIPAIERQASGLDSTVLLMPKNRSAVGGYTVTATSYALLAFLENGESAKEMDSIQKFLQEQHLSVGGFYSSHDTLRAMQALTKLAEKDQDRATYDMTFTFRSDQNENWVHSIHLNKNNWFELQQFRAPSHWGTIQTTVKGNGIALVHLTTTKHVHERYLLHEPSTKGVIDLGEFNQDITTRGFNHTFIDFKLCPRWNGNETRSGMVVMEVSLPSGYKTIDWDLQKYIQSNTHTSLRAAEFTGTQVNAYFDYINRTRHNCIEFTATREFRVANISEQTRIKVYEYHEPDNFLLTFYEKIELRKLTVCLVCGSYQCPYCEFYNSSPSLKSNFSQTMLLAISFLVLYLNLTQWKS
ncbi:CD109 antigen-like [Watersipora subatra]|uniref:CD109 antigen-like n=1 Tax=Watersipora subatra TaxID=2589382 RepID=UPI00355B7C52